jgi:hypothetical protein
MKRQNSIDSRPSSFSLGFVAFTLGEASTNASLLPVADGRVPSPRASLAHTVKTSLFRLAGQGF